MKNTQKKQDSLSILDLTSWSFQCAGTYSQIWAIGNLQKTNIRLKKAGLTVFLNYVQNVCQINEHYTLEGARDTPVEKPWSKRWLLLVNVTIYTSFCLAILSLSFQRNTFEEGMIIFLCHFQSKQYFWDNRVTSLNYIERKMKPHCSNNVVKITK